MRRTVFLAVVACLFCAAPAVAQPHPARKFVQDAPGKIDLQKDHYNLTVKQSWISSDDGFFSRIWRHKKGMTVNLKSTLVPPAGEPSVDNNQVFEREPGDNLDQPWGFAPQVVSLVPAQHGLDLTVSIVIPVEDRIAAVIGGLQKSAPPMSDIFAAPWVGYAKAVTSVVDILFGVQNDQVPFRWTGHIKDASGGNPGIVPEQYITLIAANDAGDGYLNNIADVDVRYDEKKGTLLVRDKPIENHSWVVMKLERTDGFDIARYTFDSQEPWAALALNAFVFSVVPKAANVEAVATYADNALNQLKSELALLIKTPRFSVHDRARATVAWTDMMLENVKQACKVISVPDGRCPTYDLEQFKKRLPGDLKLPPGLASTLATEASQLHGELQARKKSLKTTTVP